MKSHRRSWMMGCAVATTFVSVAWPSTVFAQTEVSPPPPPVQPAQPAPPAQPAQPAAQNTQPIELEVAPGTLSVPTVAVQQAIAQELRTPVVVTPAPVQPRRFGGGRLRITLDAEHRIQLSFRDTQDREVIRVLAAPEDPTAMVAAIALLAGNLARNQVDEVLADLTPPALPPEPVQVQPAPVQVQAVPVQAAPVLVQAVPAQVPPVPVPAVTPPVVTPPPVYDVRAGIQRRRFGFGLDAVVSTLHAAGQTMPYFLGGAWASYALTPNFAIGVNHITGHSMSAQTGPRSSFDFAPFVEVRTLLGNVVQPFAQAGAVFQVRWGGATDVAAGVMATAGGGIRFRLGEVFSLGLVGRAYVVATDSFMAVHAWLPQGAVSFAGGLELGFHL